ncbi:hypothetical protein KPL47_18940 [Clostridium estertheticum]|uniref:hypothetical protein n=1 Tax=Clostridium estertheticum TaxID=238834 RepID=UPI001C0D86F2|nr:hypothetical protein [Clostridium estertheticum]MBU3178403.1 hypothetical protein [Clostridium estertheticum]
MVNVIYTIAVFIETKMFSNNNIKFVARAESKRQFAGETGRTYYGKVVDIKVVKRKTISDIPSESEEDYLS